MPARSLAVVQLLRLIVCLVPVVLASGATAGSLPDPDVAKAADKCQKAIGAAGEKFVKSKLKKLDKCLAGIFKCIQTKEAAKQADCIAKAATKCDKGLAQIFSKDEPKLESSIVKKCQVEGKIDVADLLDADGLGFDSLTAYCENEFGLILDDVDAIAECIRRDKECTAERLFRFQFPRASELLDNAGVNGGVVGNLTCLMGAAGASDGFGATDPKGAGKALDKCAKETKKAGAKFVSAKLKSIEKCLGAIFKCVQTKPGDDACLAKATAKCNKEFSFDGKIAKAEAKLRSSVQKKCSPAIFGDLAGTTGMNLDDLAKPCVEFGGASLSDLDDYIECLFRRHECFVDDMIAVQYPRAEDLLTLVGRAGDVPAAFCPTPTPTPTVTPTPTTTPTPTATLTPNPGEFLLAITKTGPGTGTITSSPAGIDCGDTCAASFPNGDVDLTVETANGSDAYFQSWSGDVSNTCQGPRLSCSVGMTQHRLLGAHFAALDHNLVFVSSDTFAMDLGSAAAYDAACNQAATDAGINNLAGDAFMAWISTDASAAPSRLGSARGFVRRDGKPFADLASAFATFSGAILNPIWYDELGATLLGHNAATGTSPNGTVSGAGNCINFTSNDNADFRVHGTPISGPDTWTFVGGGRCDVPSRIICMMTTKTDPLPPGPGGDKLIFVSTTVLNIGVATPDQVCAFLKPAGAGSVKALISTTTVAAATHLDPGTTYARPDGHIVGTGAEIIAAGAGGLLSSGIWQLGNGGYLSFSVWTGDSDNDDMTAVGTVGGTCGDWADAGGTGSQGVSSTITDNFWHGANGVACNLLKPVYCVEQ